MTYVSVFLARSVRFGIPVGVSSLLYCMLEAIIGRVNRCLPAANVSVHWIRLHWRSALAGRNWRVLGGPRILRLRRQALGDPSARFPRRGLSGIRSNRARGLTSQHFTGAPSFASRLMDQHYSSDVCADHFSLESAALIDVWFDAERFAA